MQLEVILFGVLAAGVLTGCLLPNEWLPPLPNDKFMHFAAYAALTMLAARLAADWRAFALWSVGLLAAGLAIECLQRLVPGRGFSWPDQLANAAGIACVAVVVGLSRLAGHDLLIL
jgi:VanZ family protein